MNNNNQDNIFSEFEGNRWFERNREALEQFDPQKDLPLRIMELYSLRPQSVLEIGGANGFRLAAIRERYATARLAVVEASKEAIQDGKSRYPFIDFSHGVASAISLEEIFDLIIVNFVFHWVDRASLLRSVAEIDRLLEDGGFLIIGDFFPSNQLRVPYHHLPGQKVYTYKQNYAAPFLASGLYRMVCCLTGEHSKKELVASASEMERRGAFLL